MSTDSIKYTQLLLMPTEWISARNTELLIELQRNKRNHIASSELQYNVAIVRCSFYASKKKRGRETVSVRKEKSGIPLASFSGNLCTL
jgi:hypothetical protein